MNNDKRVIIFDFDGVIAESVNIKSVAFAEIYRPYGDDVCKKVVTHHKRNGGMSRFEKFKYYHSVFLGMKLNKSQIANLSKKFSKLVVKKVIDAPYVPGALEFISKYFKEFDFFISTGTPQDEILTILNKKRIIKYFKAIYGSPTLKGDHVHDIIKSNNYDKKNIYFIGDAETDVLAAFQNGIKIIFRVHSDNEKYIKGYKVPIVHDLISLKSIIFN